MLKLPPSQASIAGIKKQRNVPDGDSHFVLHDFAPHPASRKHARHYERDHTELSAQRLDVLTHDHAAVSWVGSGLDG